MITINNYNNRTDPYKISNFSHSLKIKINVTEKNLTFTCFVCRVMQPPFHLEVTCSFPSQLQGHLRNTA